MYMASVMAIISDFSCVAMEVNWLMNILIGIIINEWAEVVVVCGGDVSLAVVTVF